MTTEAQPTTEGQETTEAQQTTEGQETTEAQQTTEGQETTEAQQTSEGQETTEAETTPATTAGCREMFEPCVPSETSGPDACCDGLTCGPDPSDGSSNICRG